MSEVAQSCLTLCDPVDCSPPGSSVHGILQARILEWVAISFSRGSSQPKDSTWVSCIAGRCFILWATREALLLCSEHSKNICWIRVKLSSLFPTTDFHIPRCPVILKLLWSLILKEMGISDHLTCLLRNLYLDASEETCKTLASFLSHHFLEHDS